MGFYLFKLRVSNGVEDNLFHYRRDGIIAAESMEEAFKILSHSYSEDPLGDGTIVAQIIFLGGTGDDICSIGSIERDRLNKFFDWGVTNED